MGNNVVKEGDVVVPRKEYLAKLRQYETLTAAVERQKIETGKLQEQNKLLQKKIEEIQLKKDTIEKEKHVLEEGKQLLEVKLSKYDSLLSCKSILNINEQIIELQNDIKTFKTTDNKPNSELVDEVTKLRKSITDQIQNLNDNYVAALPEMKIEELEELEANLQNEQLNFQENVDTKIENLEEMLDKLNEIKEKIPNLLQEPLMSVEKELLTNKAVFNNMKSNNVDAKYKKIKTILVEQENILLRHRLKISAVTEKNYNQRPPKCNEDNRQYSLIFCNIIEEFVDGRSDYAKVQEVVNFLLNVPNLNIKIQRLGWRTSDRPRKLKVKFSCMEPVRVILRSKYKLKDGPFSAIRIFPDKFENANTANVGS